MHTFIEGEFTYSANANIPQQAIFEAQKHFNNNDMGHRVVTSAEFVDGGISAVFEDPEGLEPEEQDLSSEEQQAFDDAVEETVGESDGQVIDPESGVVVEQIGPNDPVPEKEPETLECSKCGKVYQNKGRGPEFHAKHEAKCKK